MVNKLQGKIIFTKVATVIFFIILTGNFAQAQDNKTAKTPDSLWNILSPARNSYVKDHELLIVVKLGQGEKFRVSSVTLYLDDYIVNFKAKITENRITLLYMDHLAYGKHKVKVEALTTDGGILPPLKWNFSIVAPTGITDSSKAPLAKEAAPTHKFQLQGNITLNSRNDFITSKNPDSARMERPDPLSIQELSVNMVGKASNFSIPVKLFLTNLESPTSQPIDRFNIGFVSHHVEAFIGDNFANFDEMALNGMRIRGAQLNLITGRLKFQVVYGDLTRPVEGSLVTIAPPVAPSGEMPDSTHIIVPGVYRRTMTAARLTLGKIEEGQVFGLTYTKATDDPNSITYGLSPSQNVTVGADQQLISQNKAFNLSAGISLSMTTTDITRGVSTAAHLDSTFGTNIPFEPTNFKWLIKINQSTNPIEIQDLSSLSGYIRAGAKLGFNNFNAEYRSIGPGYEAFGNPFLRNDLREISVGDNMTFWKRKITIILKAIQDNNNLRHQLPATLTTDIFIANMTLNFGPKFPALFGGVREFKQVTNTIADTVPTFYYNTNSLTTFINGGINYDLKTGKVHTIFTISYSTSTRSDAYNPSTANNTQGITGSFGQNFPFPLSYRFDYSHFIISQASLGTVSDINTYGGNITWKIKKDITSITAGYVQNLNLASLVTPGQQVRDFFTLSISQKIGKNFALRLDGGYSIFDQAGDENQSYQEKFINIALNYLINTH